MKRSSVAFSRARRLIRAYRAGLSRELSAVATYRGSLAIWMFGMVVSPYLALLVWLAALGNKPAVGPFGRDELVRYFLSVTVISMLTNAWSMYWIGESIRRGDLNFYLLQPWSYLHHHIINNIGEKLAKLVILGPMVFAVALSFREAWRWDLAWWQALALPVSVLIGAGISLFLSICIGLVGFWTTDITGIIAFYDFAESLLFGRLIPLELFPAGLHRWLALLPFRYTLSLPVEIVSGVLGQGELLAGLGVQALWLAASYLLYRLLWRLGLRRYSAVGG